MKERITIILAEDQKVFREMIIPALREFGIDTIAEAGDGKDLLKIMELKVPDILLLDIQMPEMNGNEVLPIIRKTYPQVKVIILTGFTERCLRDDFILKGVDGFLTKNMDLEKIVETIVEVKNNKHQMEVPTEDEHALFTRRELEIIPMLCGDYTLKDIANKLVITEKGVEGHRQRIYNKTNCHTKSQFTAWAVERGLHFMGAA